MRTRTDLSLGEYRRLTVRGAKEPDRVDSTLEPDVHPAAKLFKQAFVADDIPNTLFAVDDVAVAHLDLEDRSVRFIQPPTAMGPVIAAVLDAPAAT